jgi:hypothetical protein
MSGPVEESAVSAAAVERGVKAREYIQYLIDRAQTPEDREVDGSEGLFLLEFDSGIGMVTWIRTASELLAPNGSEPLVAWMLRESEVRRNTVFRLERLPTDGGAPGKSAGDYQRMAAELVENFLPVAGETEFGTSDRDLAVLEARVGWVTALSDAANYAQQELVQLQFGLVQRAKREAERERGKSGG